MAVFHLGAIIIIIIALSYRYNISDSPLSIVKAIQLDAGLGWAGSEPSRPKLTFSSVWKSDRAVELCGALWSCVELCGAM